ncbi:hypothetical protein PUMCH_001147 [Australozyma saopauloensis]|uniref:Protein HOL1 n=1 Tax=Australozyma saopauloensis TaxID=291208 RepID=A0AAX4H5P4_9ASCO|nr:hypothetical protein PUMCH_001147 [[Candida] saopauloensis]
MLDEKRSISSQESEEYIPGTVSIYSFAAEKGNLTLKTTKDNVILVPQPSDSVNDPLNWPQWKKLWNFFVLAVITGFTAATSNDAAALQDTLNKKYDISYAVMNTGAGALFVAIGWTTFLLTPVASLYGRKISYFICILLGLGGAIWFALTKNSLDAILSQIFVGASEACAEAHVQQSLMDMYFSHQLGSVLTVYISATSVGTYLGPLIAGFIVTSPGFRWVGWIAAIISGVLLVVIVFGMHETIFHRTKYQGFVNELQVGQNKMEQALEDSNKLISESIAAKKTTDGDSAHRSLDSRMSSHNDMEAVHTCHFGANEPQDGYWKQVQLITKAPNLVGIGFKQYIKRLIVLFRVFTFPPLIFSGLVWGMQDALLTFYLTVEDNQYFNPPFNYGNTGVALMNIPCLIGALIGCIYAGTVSDWFTIWMAKRNGGIQEAEFRLYFLIIPAVLCPVGLILFAVGTDQVWHWGPTYFGLGLVGVGFGASGDVAMGYLMDAYPDMVVEMMAGVSVINNMFGCIFTFTCSQWLDAMSNTKTFAILAAITLVIMGSAIPFIIYGKRIRRWTKPKYLEYCRLRDHLDK